MTMTLTMTLSPGQAVVGSTHFCWADDVPATPGRDGIFVNARECRQVATTDVGLCALHYDQICGEGVTKV